MTEAGSRLVIVTNILKCSSLGLFVHILYVYIILLVYQWLYDIYSCVWLRLHWQKKIRIWCTRVNTKTHTRSNFFVSDLKPFPNVVLNQIHIRYLDTRATSKHISDSPRTPQYEGRRVCSWRFLMPACCMLAFYWDGNFI